MDTSFFFYGWLGCGGFLLLAIFMFTPPAQEPIMEKMKNENTFRTHLKGFPKQAYDANWCLQFNDDDVNSNAARAKAALKKRLKRVSPRGGSYQSDPQSSRM